MSLADWIRARTRSRRPGTLLVRLPQPDPPPAPRALPAPWPVCRRCGQRHEPRPGPGDGGRGLAAAYSQQLLAEPGQGRPQPLGSGPPHDRAVLRDTVNPWRASSPDPPPPSTDLVEVRDELHAPRTYWWEERER